jgi:hypothetical protein
MSKTGGSFPALGCRVVFVGDEMRLPSAEVFIVSLFPRSPDGKTQEPAGDVHELLPDLFLIGLPFDAIAGWTLRDGRDDRRTSSRLISCPEPPSMRDRRMTGDQRRRRRAKAHLRRVCSGSPGAIMADLRPALAWRQIQGNLVPLAFRNVFLRNFEQGSY